MFLYRNFYLVKEKYQKGVLTEEDFKNAEKEMLRFNNNFNEPLRDHVIEVNTRSVNHTQYLFKNETLKDYLELSWEQCEEIGLDSIYKTKTQEQWNKDYYNKKLKSQNKLSKKEEIKQRRTKIKDLLAQGLTQKEIYTYLNISKRTCISDVKFLKEQGLI